MCAEFWDKLTYRSQNFMGNLPHAGKLGTAIEGFDDTTVRELPTKGIGARQRHVRLIELWINVSPTIGVADVKHKLAPREGPSAFILQNRVVPPVRKGYGAHGDWGIHHRKVLASRGPEFLHDQVALAQYVSWVQGTG